MIDKDKVLQLVRMKGPVLPVHISKEFKTDTLTMAAILSELCNNQQLLLSHTKIGGSPVYYTKEQKPKLQDLYKHLNEKDKKTFDLLKEEKIIRDSEHTPLIRVSLRNIKDFAKPLEVNINNNKEIFWKWYLLEKDEAINLIKIQIGVQKPRVPTPKPKEEPKKETKEEIKQEPPKIKQKTEQLQVPKEKPVETEQESLKQFDDSKINDPFYLKTKNFFNQKGIIIDDIKIIRKKSEIDYTIMIPSPVGTITYYCKTKNKKKINDGDLAAAVISGESKKLPVFFITTGELTKKAKTMLGKEFKNLKLAKLTKSN